MNAAAANNAQESQSSEEGKIVMIVDTSEAYSSDNQPVAKNGSSNSDTQSNFSASQSNQQDQDSYFKVKMHAMSCL